ncbi:SRR1 family protein [Aspergillus undulatus]|uniref:SRR1 family protein n=1 Tax=Aspergillus undulatus TaxID=1810928 RepID=UPI003CCD84F5
MPHTRRKKTPSHQNKRLTVTDDSGWTHVTTTGNARRIGRKQSATPKPIPKPGQENADVHEEPEPLEPLVPAEAPPKTTLSTLRRHLVLYRERWEGSATWRCVVDGLRRGLPLFSSGSERSLEQQLSELEIQHEREEEDKDNGSGNDNGTGGEDKDDSGLSIVCIGLGSPSGFLRGGWVDRRAVSMYQLAALVSLMEWIEKNTPPSSTSNPNPKPPTYAQDPVFNTHDTTLLSSQTITVLTHPSAFTKISPNTILFAPGAERRHLELLLARNPAVVIGGPLEDIESDVVKRWLSRRGSVKLDVFEELETAFWGMSVYYPSVEEGEVEDG